jgi:stage II sporulation protein D
MKRGAYILVAVMMAFSLLALTLDSNVYAASYPDTVKVGLYYGKDQVSSVSFNSKAGLEVGYFANNTFTTLLTETAGKAVTIRKDAYFIKSSAGVTSEYNPSEGLPFAGDTIGPYHVQIGPQATDLSTALSLAEIVKGSGIPAFPAYDNGWYVWTGFYTDTEKANAELKLIAEKMGTSQVSLVPPSSSRVVILNDAFEPKMVFTSTDYKVRVRPAAANNPYVLSVNGRQYRGEFEIRRYLDSDLTVINIVNIEQYLYGVVPEELEASAPLEALKAQAVAARTYTYMHIGNYSKWGFDVVDTVDSQVYKGYDSEKAATNRAVDETQGKKVLYEGKLASLFYFSSSGGMTEDNTYVWGTPIAYLKSVPDPYESGKSYNYNWTKTFTAEDIKRTLFLSGVEIGDIVSVTAEEFTPAGRVTKLKFVGTAGQITYYRADGRTLLGLPSQMYTINSGSSGASFAVSGDGAISEAAPTSTVVSADGTTTLSLNGQVQVVSSGGQSSLTVSSGGSSTNGTYVFTGKGYGHGIGMSQEGAKGFALQGYTYDQILKHYFTGVTVE